MADEEVPEDYEEDEEEIPAEVEERILRQRHSHGFRTEAEVTSFVDPHGDRKYIIAAVGTDPAAPYKRQMSPLHMDMLGNRYIREVEVTASDGSPLPAHTPIDTRLPKGHRYAEPLPARLLKKKMNKNKKTINRMRQPSGQRPLAPGSFARPPTHRFAKEFNELLRLMEEQLEIAIARSHIGEVSTALLTLRTYARSMRDIFNKGEVKEADPFFKHYIFQILFTIQKGEQQQWSDVTNTIKELQELIGYMSNIVLELLKKDGLDIESRSQFPNPLGNQSFPGLEGLRDPPPRPPPPQRNRKKMLNKTEIQEMIGDLEQQVEQAYDGEDLDEVVPPLTEARGIATRIRDAFGQSRVQEQEMHNMLTDIIETIDMEEEKGWSGTFYTIQSLMDDIEELSDFMADYDEATDSAGSDYSPPMASGASAYGAVGGMSPGQLALYTTPPVSYGVGARPKIQRQDNLPETPKKQPPSRPPPPTPPRPMQPYDPDLEPYQAKPSPLTNMQDLASALPNEEADDEEDDGYMDDDDEPTYMSYGNDLDDF